ncbi:MAG: hypothetical protein V4850_29530 [Myxococcota bacterium]
MHILLLAIPAVHAVVPAEVTRTQAPDAAYGSSIGLDINDDGRVLVEAGGVPAYWDEDGTFTVLEGSQYPSVYDLNEAGQTVGGGVDGFLWNADGTIAQTVELGTRVMAYRLNDLGDFVGTWHNWPYTTMQAFAWFTTTGAVEITGFERTPEYVWPSVNNPGQVSGYYRDTNDDFHCWYWSRTDGYMEISEVSGDCIAGRMTDAGVLAGTFLANTGSDTPFVWSVEGGLELLELPVGYWGWTGGMNRQGWVTGWGEDASGASVGLVWDGSGALVHEIRDERWPTLRFRDINDQGHVSGVGETASGHVEALFWSEATGLVLLPGIGGTSTFAGGLNELDQVVGTGKDAAGRQHALRWDVSYDTEVPVDEALQEIVTFVDAAVAAGTLVGSGRGGSADGRLAALVNMLEAVEDLLAVGDVDGAREQLLAVLDRTDGAPQPPDFVAGSAAAELAARVTELLAELE